MRMSLRRTSSEKPYGMGAALGAVEVAVANMKRAGADTWEAEVVRRALRRAVALNYGDDALAAEELAAMLGALSETPNRGLARLYRMPEVYRGLRRVIMPPAARLARTGTGPN